MITGKQSIVAEHKKFWQAEHSKQNLFRQYRIVNNEAIAERDSLISQTQPVHALNIT